MSYLIAIIANNLASTSYRHTTMTMTSETTSTTAITIAIISLCIGLYPISIIGALSHEVKTMTLIFIMSH